jgi:hypothetical protein
VFGGSKTDEQGVQVLHDNGGGNGVTNLDVFCCSDFFIQCNK